MTNLTPLHPHGVRRVAGVTVPAVSAWLREAMAHVADPHPDLGIEPSRLRQGVREEAARVAAAMEPAFKPATTSHWEMFLEPFRVLPGSPADRREFAAALRPIEFALNDIPAAILTPERQREALRSLRYFPTPNDLDRILRPALNDLLRERRLLDAIAKTPTNEAREQPSDHERAAMADRAAELAAELRAASVVSAGAACAATPRTLSPDALIAGYEAAGTPAALYRAEQLRRQMGGA